MDGVMMIIRKIMRKLAIKMDVVMISIRKIKRKLAINGCRNDFNKEIMRKCWKMIGK